MQARIHITEGFVELLTRNATEATYWELRETLRSSETYETWLPREDGKEELWHAFPVHSEEDLHTALVALANETTADSLCYKAQELLENADSGAIVVNNTQLEENN